MQCRRHVTYINLVRLLEPDISRWQVHVRVTISLQSVSQLPHTDLRRGRGDSVEVAKGSGMVPVKATGGGLALCLRGSVGMGYSLAYSMDDDDLQKRVVALVRWLLDSKYTHAQGLSQVFFIPFTHAYLESNCHKQYQADPPFVGSRTCRSTWILRTLSISFNLQPTPDPVLWVCNVFVR
jgi:hypothetical protein